MCKATLLIGVHRLAEIAQRCGKNVANLSLAEIEELAVVAHAKAKRTKDKRVRHRKPDVEQSTGKKSLVTDEVTERTLQQSPSFAETSPEKN